MAGTAKERNAKKRAKEADRRQPLVAATENIIKAKGLSAVKARDVAEAAGVGLGSIYYNRDLDDLILEANANTLTELEKALAGTTKGDPASRLIAMAEAYLQFAGENTLRWKALFEHKLPAGKLLPEWYLGHQLRLFDKVDDALREVDPTLSRSQSAELARTIFSAVHGVVSLGLDEKLGLVPPKSLRQQLKVLIASIITGLDSNLVRIPK